MHSTLFFASFIILTILVLPSDQHCEPDQVRHGCRINQGQCDCGTGCYAEYRYNDKEECIKAIKARRIDICMRNPCMHQGVCSQISQVPGFKCRCEGTGYYGARCQNACPKPGVIPKGERAYPYECIII